MKVSLSSKLTSFSYASAGEASCGTLALTTARTQAHSLDLTTGSSSFKVQGRLRYRKLQDKEVRQALNLGLTNRFDALSSDENLTPDKRWETFKTVMTETADEILGRAKIKRQHWITARNPCQ